MSLADRLRAIRVDLTPYRQSRDFRLLLVAGTVFYLGAMVSYVAIPWQVYHLTGSNLMVGVIGLIELAPLIVFGLWGGASADHHDRRRILIVCGLILLAVTIALSLNAFRPEPSLGVIFACAAVGAAASAFQRPSRESLLPRTVTHDQIPAANALASLGAHLGMLLGPTIGGLLLASVGAGWCFLVESVGLLIAVGMFARLGDHPHRGETSAPSFAGIAEGWRYAVRRRDLLGTYLVDIAAMMLAMPVVLFPALAAEVFAQPELLGPLYTAETVGALLASATSGWISRVHHHGRIIVIAAAIYGGFVALAGLAPSIWWCLAALVAAGASDMVSALFRGTIWNQTIPEAMRGRLAGIEMLSYSVGPLAGQMRAGFVADRFSVRGAVTSGGIACVVGVAVTAAWLRQFWSYDARTDPHAQAERRARGEAAADAPVSDAG